MPLLEVSNLTTHFKVRRGWVHAVDGVSFTLEKGEALGLVGESGCGKTTLGYSIAQLLPSNGYIKAGSVIFRGMDLIQLSRRPDGTLDEYNEEMRRIRWKHISMIFQGAMNAFNPVYTVGSQILEAIQAHEDVTQEEGERQVRELFQLVGIPGDRINSYPHEYSGGMRQRAMIAMALALGPDLIIADEPTTALDVIMQDRILGEMARIRREIDASMVIITHDVSIVAETAQRIAVMYAGRIVETGTTEEIFHSPAHPYTEGLLGAFPTVTGPKKHRLISIPGNPPSLLAPPSGCRFHPRCRYAKDICKTVDPPPVDVGKGHLSACHFALELKGQLGGG